MVRARPGQFAAPGARAAAGPPGAGSGALKFAASASDNTPSVSAPREPARRTRARSARDDEGGSQMLDGPGHQPEDLDHPNVHIAALFDGAIQFAREALDARDAGREADAERRVGWVRAVLVDLAQRVGWGTGTIGRQIAAILTYLSQRLVADARSRDGLARFIRDLTTVYGLWGMICGRGSAPRAAA
jgi:hypothetical protein